MRRPILVLCLALSVIAAPFGGGFGFAAAQAGQTHQMTVEDGGQPSCHDEGQPTGQHPKAVPDGFTCCPQAAIFLPSACVDMAAPSGKTVLLPRTSPTAKTASRPPPDKPPRS